MSGPRYPNQQLKAVALETYFKGRFSMLAALGSIQSEYGERYPNLFVPHAQHGQAPAVQPFQLRSEDQAATISVAVNQASFASSQYPGHEAFAETAIPTLARVLELGGVESLERVVYRYDNQIGLSRGVDRVLPVRQVLQLPDLPGFDGGIVDLDLGWSVAWDRGHAGIKIAIDSLASAGGAVLQMTIAATVSPAGDVRDLDEFAAVAHERAFAAFDKLITADFRAHLLGPSDEEAQGA